LAQTSELKLPIIIDTPLSRLDSTHRDNIVNNYFPNAGEQVIILRSTLPLAARRPESTHQSLHPAGL
jgi:DNA sulfur modification protein DndD